MRATYTGKFYDDHKKEIDWADGRCWVPFVVSLIVVLFIGMVLALWWGGAAYFNENVAERSTEYFGSAHLDPGARLHKLSSAGSALQITLLNDLSPYKNQQHTIVSTTGQPHTIVIQSGPLGTAWDVPGTSLTATFGGAINDGFSFRVVAKDQIHVTHTTNVVFS